MIRRISQAFTIAICVGYLIVGLWPFNFLPRNGVTWLPEGRGIHFREESQVYTDKWLDLAKDVPSTIESAEATIELWLRPDTEPWEEMGSILSLYDGEVPENLFIAQWQSGLLLRVPLLDASGRRTYREVGIGDVMHRGVRRCITITANSSGTTFYADGVFSDEYPRVKLRPMNLRGRLVLGTTPDGMRDWLGSLYSLALFNRSLSAAEILRRYRLLQAGLREELLADRGLVAAYFFDEGNGQEIRDRSPSGNAIVIPAAYQVLRKTMLLPPWKDIPNWPDVVVNILGFIPFGFFFAIYRMRTLPGHGLRNAVITLCAATMVSAAIELIQVYLPSRSSSLMDLFCNTAGAGIGMLFPIMIRSLLKILPGTGQ